MTMDDLLAQRTKLTCTYGTYSARRCAETTETTQKRQSLMYNNMGVTDD